MKFSCPLLCCIFLSVVLNGCGSENSSTTSADLSTNTPPKKTLANQTSGSQTTTFKPNNKVVQKKEASKNGSISSEPFLALQGTAKKQSDFKFTLLPNKETGVQFISKLDLDHPMKRLYYSGFACGGVAVGDIDGDSKPDIYLVSGPNKNRLFRQVGEMKFEDITDWAGVGGGNNWGAGVSMADVDNDGDLDILVCNYNAPASLYINQGNGKFSERGKESGLGFQDATLMSSFCDFDNDGDLDVYMLTNQLYRKGGRPTDKPYYLDKQGVPRMKPEYKKYYALINKGIVDGTQKYDIDSIGRPDRLFVNDGKGNFTDVTKKSGIDTVGYGLSLTWWDYDNDGLMDIYIGNDFSSPDYLWHNNGDGTFSNELKNSLNRTTWFSMGAEAGDLNNDGLIDLMSADMSSTTHYKQKTTMGNMSSVQLETLNKIEPRQFMQNTVYVNTGMGRFMEIARQSHLSSTDWTWSVKMNDFDNNGYLDIYLTNGTTRRFNDSDVVISKEDRTGKTEWELYENSPKGNERNIVYQNHGDFKFTNESKDWGLDHNGVSYGVAVADLDGDGDLDIVTVNIDEETHIYRNESSTNHQVQIKLQGTQSNHYGVGAMVEIEVNDQKQIRQLMPTSGFLSCSVPSVHFGLSENKVIDKLTVRWPSKVVQVFTNLKADQLYTITEPTQGIKESPKSIPAQTMFAHQEVPDIIRHYDRDFNDFKLQPLLPNKMSQFGPGLASCDLDGDGDSDYFLGQGAGVPGLLLMTGENSEESLTDKTLAKDKDSEDMGALFFDADNDGDFDLYVVSGSVEYPIGSENYQDRLYLNDGKGVLTAAPKGSLPEMTDSGSCVVAVDFDHDGDLDLFIGGRVVPGKYPLPGTSHLLQNNNGVFTDVTEKLAPGLAKSGLVTSALWSDVDNDGWVDLLVTYEWGPVRLWKNEEGVFSDATDLAQLQNRTGWWNSISGADIDSDGDIDYLVTNFGLNTKYHASDEKPALLYYGDFEGNDQPRIVEAEFENETLYPIRGKSCSSNAMPHLKQKFSTFHQFAIAPLQEIYTPKCLESSWRFAANTLESGVLINDGTGRFKFKKLPTLAQISPGFGTALHDIDGDGNVDAFIAQNFYGPQLETGRMDSGLSLLLRGNGDGTFSGVWPKESGILVPEDAKSLITTDINHDGWPDFIIGLRNDKLKIYRHNGSKTNRMLTLQLKGSKKKPLIIGSLVTAYYKDGRTLAAELYAGSGYLSQSDTTLYFGLGASASIEKFSVRWPDGTIKTYPVENKNLKQEITRSESEK